MTELLWFLIGACVVVVVVAVVRWANDDELRVVGQAAAICAGFGVFMLCLAMIAKYGREPVNFWRYFEGPNGQHYACWGHDYYLTHYDIGADCVPIDEGKVMLEPEGGDR